jgi:hypothetical protein
MKCFFFFNNHNDETLANSIQQSTQQREREERTRGLSQTSEKIIILLYSWLPTGTYYKILRDLDLFSFCLSLSLCKYGEYGPFFSLRKIISIISGNRIFQLEI